MANRTGRWGGHVVREGCQGVAVVWQAGVCVCVCGVCIGGSGRQVGARGGGRCAARRCVAG